MRRNLATIFITAAILFAPCPSFHGADWEEIPKSDLALPFNPHAPSEPAMILLDERIMSRGITECHRIVKIFNKKGFDDADVSIPYGPDHSVSCVEGRTIHKDGKVFELRKDQVFDQRHAVMDSMERGAWRAGQVVFAMPAVEEGCVIEYTYRLNGPWDRELLTFRNELFTRLIRVRATPFSEKVRYKVKFYPDGFDIPSEKDDTGTYLWEVRDVPAYEPEPYGPSFRLLREHLTITVQGYHSEQTVGEKKYVYHRHYRKDWDQLGNLIYDNLRYYVFTDKAFQKEAGKVLKSLKTKTRKEYVERIFDFVQREIENNGDFRTAGGSDLGRILERREGDPEDLGLLLVGLLNKVGLKVYPAYVRRKDYQEADEDLVSEFQFSHVVAAVEGKDGYTWLDPSAGACPVDRLPWYDQGTKAFLMTDDGHRFVRIPEQEPVTSREELRTRITIGEEGNISATSKLSYTGCEAVKERCRMRNLTKEGRKDRLESIARRIDENADVGETGIGNEEAFGKPLELDCSYKCLEAAQRAGEMIIVSPSSFAMTPPNPFTAERRRHPIHIRYPIEYARILEIEIPAGYRASEIPAETSLDLDPCAFELKVEEGEGSVRLEETIKLDKGIFPPSEYRKFKKFFAFAAKINEKPVIFEKK